MLNSVRLTLLVTTLAVLGCSGDPEAPDDGNGDDAAVVIDMTSELRFSPGTVTIEEGETVRWRNASSVVHTVTADASLAQDAANVELPSGAESFNSGSIAGGGSFARTFTVPGTYRYFCIPHESAAMVGTVVVTAR